MKILIEAETLDMAVAGLRVLKRELTEGIEYSLGQEHKVNRMYPVTNDSGSGFMLRITPTGYTVRELVLVEQNHYDYWKNARKKGRMTMYKPRTKLIMKQRWSAEAAHELGFEVEVNNTMSLTGKEALSDLFTGWRITVTESGPNAAERFLPQVDDAVELGDGALRLTGEIDETTNYSPCGDFWSLSEVKRIIERNGIPFPQFSEVIEP